MSVEIHNHTDGRIAVTVNGRVRWCGRNRAVAHLIAQSCKTKSPGSGQARRDVADAALPRAIDVMRRA